eukprot:14593770-Alexandrium_andersonii.AAC.1
MGSRPSWTSRGGPSWRTSWRARGTWRRASSSCGARRTPRSGLAGVGTVAAVQSAGTVSYTHLTLPTICSV